MSLVKKYLDDTVLYVNPEIPDWYILNAEAEAVIDSVSDEKETKLVEKSLQAQLAVQPSPIYNGRDESYSKSFPEEIWLHITDRCNLACRHCLFSCNPKSQTELLFDDIKKIVEEAFSQGTETFYLTGGEPMIHRDFQKICELILEKAETRLIILTNGLLIKNTIDFLQTLPQQRLFYRSVMRETCFFMSLFVGKAPMQIYLNH